MKNKKLYDALKYIDIALEMYPDDEEILIWKSRTLCRLNRVDEAIHNHKKLLSQKPDNNSLILELIELLFFTNKIDEAELLISKNKLIFEKKVDGKLSKLCYLFKFYHLKDEVNLLKKIKELIDLNDMKSNTKRMKGWILLDALYTITHFEDSKFKIMILNTVWYLDGQMNGESLCQILGIDISKLQK